MTKYDLKRDLFLGGSRYRQQAGGTDLPDHVTDEAGVTRKVVPWRKGETPKDDEIFLPRDAEPHDPKKPFAGRTDRRLIGAEKAVNVPTALSELPKHGQSPESATTKKVVEDEDEEAPPPKKK